MRRTALALALLIPMATHEAAWGVPRAQEAVPLVGNWQLNIGRTHYGPGVDRRRRERMACSAETAGVHCVIRSVRSDGRELIGQFTAAVDGIAAPVTGIPDVDEVRLRAPHVSLVDAIFFFHNKPVFGYRAFPSEDGQSLIIVSIDPVSGAAATTVVVYDRR